MSSSFTKEEPKEIQTWTEKIKTFKEHVDDFHRLEDGLKPARLPTLTSELEALSRKWLWKFLIFNPTNNLGTVNTWKMKFPHDCSLPVIESEVKAHRKFLNHMDNLYAVLGEGTE